VCVCVCVCVCEGSLVRAQWIDRFLLAWPCHKGACGHPRPSMIQAASRCCASPLTGTQHRACRLSFFDASMQDMAHASCHSPTLQHWGPLDSAGMEQLQPLASAPVLLAPPASVGRTARLARCDAGPGLTHRSAPWCAWHLPFLDAGAVGIHRCSILRQAAC